MIIFVSEFLGGAFTLDEDTLITTPLHGDSTFDTCIDNWVEVDHMALLGEEEVIRTHVEYIEDKLRRDRDGIFADPARM